MKLRDRVDAAWRNAALADPGKRIDAAIGGFMSGLKVGFPDLSGYLQYQPWPLAQEALNFPRAAALVPTVYACLNRIANDVASLAPTFYQGKGQKRKVIERKSGNILDLWMKANPSQSGYEMERDRQFTLDVNGNGYLFMDKMGQAEPQELWTLPGHLVRPIPGPRRTVAYYEFGVHRLGVKLLPENVIPFRYVNPDWDPLEPAPVGLSPLQAAQKAYETRYGMQQWQNEFFKRGGNVAHIFSIKDGGGAADAKIKQWQESYAKRYQGIENAFKPMFMQNVEFMRAGLTQAEMMYLETAQLCDADICRVFGIPPADMGITENKSSLSQGGASTRSIAYWQQSVIPRIMLRDAVLTEKLCPLFGDDITCDTDLSGIFAIQEASLNQSKSMVILTGRPVMTVNEARERMDLPLSDDPTADELTQAQNLTGKVADGMPDSVATDPQGGKAPKGAGGEPQGAGAKDQAKNSRAALGALEAHNLNGAGSIPAPATKKLSLIDRRKRANADLARYERRVAAAFNAHFDRQETEALARLERQGRHGGADIASARNGSAKRILNASYNPDELVNSDDAEEQKALQAVFDAFVAERGVAAAAEIGVEVATQAFTEKVKAQILARVDRMIALTDETTRRLLREKIAALIARPVTETQPKAGFSEIAAAVRAAFDDRRANALTIARTETAWAYNAAAHEAWKSAGVPMKSWLTAEDDRVRDTHMEAENAGAIPMDEPFMVGGYETMYPGGTGDPGEDINCRCIVQPEFGDDSSGEDAGFARLFSTNGHKTTNRLAHLFEKVGA